MKIFSTITTSDRFFAVQDSLYENLSHPYVMITLTVLPVLLLFTVISVLPIGWALVSSFFEISTYGNVWTWNGIEHFQSLASDGEFLASIWRSAIYAVGSVAFQVTIGVAMALMVNRSFKYSRVARSLAMLPYLVPTAVVGMIALWMGNTSWGVINAYPQQLGLIDGPIEWFGDQTMAMFSVIMAGVWKWSAFVMIFVLARLQSIPDGLYEAARVAGASRYQLFRDITLPNLRGILFIVILLRGIWMFNKFDIIYIITQGGPLSATETSPIYVEHVAFSQGLLGESMAISVVLFFFLGIGSIIYFKVANPSQVVQVE